MDVTLVEQHVRGMSVVIIGRGQAKTTGEVKRRRLVKSADVVTRGRVEGLVFSSGLATGLVARLL